MALAALERVALELATAVGAGARLFDRARVYVCPAGSDRSAGRRWLRHLVETLRVYLESEASLASPRRPREHRLESLCTTQRLLWHPIEVRFSELQVALRLVRMADGGEPHPSEAIRDANGSRTPRV